MSNVHRSLLTTRDYSILVALLERDTRHDEAFLRLLRRKLAGATVVFRDDIAPHVATIGGRVEFTVDGHLAERRILVDGEVSLFPDLALPITTLRGLALLGLSAGETTRIERADVGGEEELRLDSVSPPPEVTRVQRSRRTAPEGQSSVTAFQSRRGSAIVRSMAFFADPNDDDPGPRSA